MSVTDKLDKLFEFANKKIYDENIIKNESNTINKFEKKIRKLFSDKFNTKETPQQINKKSYAHAAILGKTQEGKEVIKLALGIGEATSSQEEKGQFFEYLRNNEDLREYDIKEILVIPVFKEN